MRRRKCLSLKETVIKMLGAISVRLVAHIEEYTYSLAGKERYTGLHRCLSRTKGRGPLRLSFTIIYKRAVDRPQRGSR